MIKCKSEQTRYKVLLTNGKHKAFSDTTKDKGGGESGFRPHELLEAALASCMTIWLRMYAESHEIPLSEVSTQVFLDRGAPGEAIFEYAIELGGPLVSDQRARLLQVARKCPVHQTLSKRISFRDLTEDAPGEHK